jgi:hypothetical protein
MSNHFIGLAVGGTTEGLTPKDYTLGTSTTSTLDVELRIADANQNSKPILRGQVVDALLSLLHVYQGPANQPGLQTYPDI